ncbi:MAG: hypothetical protein OHK0052_12930 [Anaerolineales bacterium]
MFIPSLFHSLQQAPAAYIDPNTGGMLFQILAVLFATFSGVIFFFSRQIKTFFAKIGRTFRKENDTQQPKSDEQ